MRIARKHLGWYTKDLAGGDAFRARGERGWTTARADRRGRADSSIRSPNRASGSTYRAPAAAIVDAHSAFATVTTTNRNGAGRPSPREKNTAHQRQQRNRPRRSRNRSTNISAGSTASRRTASTTW